jgi:hypothetical protein
MGKIRGTPSAQVGVGSFAVLKMKDPEHKHIDGIAWSNTGGVAGRLQWIGWKNVKSEKKVLIVSVWLMFLSQVPPISDNTPNYGLKVYGVVYNKFINSCQPNNWCFGSVTVQPNSHVNGSNILLIFNSVNQHQIVLVSHFQYEIITAECLASASGRYLYL